MDFKIGGAFLPWLVLSTAITIVMQELQNPRLSSVVILQGVFVLVAGVLYHRQLLDLLKIYYLNYKGLKQLSQDLFQDAERSFQEAIAIADRKRNKHVHYENRQTFNNLGLLYERRGNYSLAKYSYERALKYEDSVWVKVIFYLSIPFGIYFAALEEFWMFRDRYTRENSFISTIITIIFVCSSFISFTTTEIFLFIFLFLAFKVFRIRTANRIRKIRTLLQIEDLNLSMGQYSEVLDKSTEQKTRALGNAFLRSNALNNIGLAYFYQKKYPEALEYFKQANTIHSQVLYSQIDKPIEYGMTLLNLGATYAALDQPAKALDYYKQAFLISEKTERLSLVSLALFRQGTTEAQSQHFKALEYYNLALMHARKMGYRAMEAKILHQKGLTLFQIGRFAEAELTLFSTIGILETLRASELSDADKITLLETQTDTYIVLQEVLIAQSNINRALEIAERGRARAFVDLLAKRLSPATQSQAAPTVKQIQHIAQTHNATLVEFSLISNQTLFIWVIQPTGEIRFRTVKLGILHQQQISLSDLVFLARQSLGVRDVALISLRMNPDTEHQISLFPERRISSYPEIPNPVEKPPLQVLFQLLIEPITEFLPKRETDLVIFVPHQDLFFVPFAALIDTQGSSLIESHTIQITPSIQILELTQRLQRGNSIFNHPLIVGNPVMPQVTVESEQSSISLMPLLGARREVEEIAAMLKTKVRVLLEAQATKAAVLQQMPQASLIHLATHGLLNEIKGIGVPGAIALAPDGTGEPNDGLLTASEILELKLQADLVVLSCCNTGLGQITSDGVIGLTRCLFAAGVPSVIVSLWSVPDEATAFLMTEFYRHLLARQDKAQALRQAMLVARQHYSNPYHWAAFTLIGEAE